MRSLPSLEVIRDSREKPGQGWFWEPEEKQSGKIQIVGTEISALNYGDYSLRGYEDIVRIERKFGISEIFGNMMPKEHKDRFEREAEKLSKIPYKYILIETVISSDLLGMSVPQIFRGPPCSAITKWLLELHIKYGVVPMFVGDCGKKIARQIFESVVRYGNPTASKISQPV